MESSLPVQNGGKGTLPVSVLETVQDKVLYRRDVTTTGSKGLRHSSLWQIFLKKTENSCFFQSFSGKKRGVTGRDRVEKRGKKRTFDRGKSPSSELNSSILGGNREFSL